MTADQIAGWLQGLGGAFALCLASLVLLAANGFLYWTLGKLGCKTWMRMANIYKLHQLEYWLDRLRKSGLYDLEREHEARVEEADRNDH
jgi:hypothetical protein